MSFTTSRPLDAAAVSGYRNSAIQEVQQVMIARRGLHGRPEGLRGDIQGFAYCLARLLIVDLCHSDPELQALTEACSAGHPDATITLMQMTKQVARSAARSGVARLGTLRGGIPEAADQLSAVIESVPNDPKRQAEFLLTLISAVVMQATSQPGAPALAQSQFIALCDELVDLLQARLSEIAAHAGTQN